MSDITTPRNVVVCDYYDAHKNKEIPTICFLGELKYNGFVAKDHVYALEIIYPRYLQGQTFNNQFGNIIHVAEKLTPANVDLKLGQIIIHLAKKIAELEQHNREMGIALLDHEEE